MARLRPALWAIAVAAGVLVAAATWVVVRSVMPTDGAPIVIDYGFARGLTADPLPGDPSPLRSGDVVVAVEGIPVDEVLAEAPSRHPGIRPGAEWHYQLIRDGQTLDLAVRLRHGDFVLERLRHAGASIAIGLVVLMLGVYTVLRRPEHPATRALLLFGAGLTAYNVFGALSSSVAELVAARCCSLPASRDNGIPQPLGHRRSAACHQLPHTGEGPAASSSAHSRALRGDAARHRRRPDRLPHLGTGDARRPGAPVRPETRVFCTPRGRSCWSVWPARSPAPDATRRRVARERSSPWAWRRPSHCSWAATFPRDR